MQIFKADGNPGNLRRTGDLALNALRIFLDDTNVLWQPLELVGGIMADHLEVDPIDLHMSSDHMAVHHAELQAAHTAADGVIEGAQAGWVGASAAALQTKFAEWQQATAEMTGDLAAHGAAFSSAARGYEGVDSESAGNLDGQL